MTPYTRFILLVLVRLHPWVVRAGLKVWLYGVKWGLL